MIEKNIEVNTPIPSEVWDTMPQNLKETVATAQKGGAEISYEPGSHNGFLAADKTFDKITITSRLDGSIHKEEVESYNVKNGIRTSFRRGCGPGAYGGEYDPEGINDAAVSWVS